MSAIAYYRVSTSDQSVHAQRAVLTKTLDTKSFDKEFFDEGISGSIPAAARPGFSSLLNYIREGDTLYIYAVDRLGRDALDIQTTIRGLLNKNVNIVVFGLGMIGKGVGEIIIAVLAQIADMEKQKIIERTKHGREIAKKTLIETGKTHKGKLSLGRPIKANPTEVKSWRNQNKSSITDTAIHFNLSISTVKRYCSNI